MTQIHNVPKFAASSQSRYLLRRLSSFRWRHACSNYAIINSLPNRACRMLCAFYNLATELPYCCGRQVSTTEKIFGPSTDGIICWPLNPFSTSLRGVVKSPLLTTTVVDYLVAISINCSELVTTFRNKYSTFQTPCPKEIRAIWTMENMMTQLRHNHTQICASTIPRLFNNFTFRSKMRCYNRSKVWKGRRECMY